MKVLGLIAEYNPFHNGHLCHMERAKRLTKATHTVVVMSGNFTQRGEPALCDKWLRARMALEHGADMVIELPVFFAASSAEYFASAAVKLLHSTGLVSALCFGSESGDLDAMKAAAKFLSRESPAFQQELKRLLDKGLSFAAARERAMLSTSPAGCFPEGLLSKANNILGVEYLKALIKLESHIEPHTITRSGCAPAKAIRQAVLNGCALEIEKFMPPRAYALLSQAVIRGETAALENYGDIFQYKLRTTDPAKLAEYAEMSEGLGNRFRRMSGGHSSLTGLIGAVKTKRYTRTRLQRAVLHLILGINTLRGGAEYIRVLGFRKDSATLLRELEQNASLPVILNLKHAEKKLSTEAMSMLNKEIETTDVYMLARAGKRALRYEYTMPLVIV
ncbi:MAG: nucleotidyltransferase family protein [Clostridiales bacterium]|nr:nucleotidyltransferase family protein [Clostridiales bacterium]